MSSLLQQVGTLIFVIAGAVTALECALYWFLTFHRRSIFLVASLLWALPLAALFRWSSQTTQGQETLMSWPVAFVGALVVALALAVVSKYWLKGAWRIPILMMAPALLAVSLLVIYPFLFELRLSFAGLNLYSIQGWLAGEPLEWVGWKNFVRVFTTSPLQTATFMTLLGRTILWTAANVFFHVLFGLTLAMILNRKLKGRGFYRTLLIIPWAMPQVVAVLAWRGEFHPQFGGVNMILGALGLPSVNWWSDPIPVFLSCLGVNIWLGIPFMMIVFLGGLQSIPHSYYEAARIDGANRWQQFVSITIPMLKPVVVPSVTLGTIWTFNNINVIYLMTGQDGGNEYADILISALYKSAFTYYRYSFSAAFALVQFLILIGITVVWMRVTRGTEDAVGNR